MKNDVNRACSVLKKGGIILYPTDTIWGIGCDATNHAAIQKIFNIKKRDDKKSMLVLMGDASMLPDYVSEIPDIALELTELSNKPVTIIYPRAKNLPDNLVAGDGSIGIRITSDPFCRLLIKKFGKPIVSTSANISGDPSPAIFSEIPDWIIQSVDYTVNWRRDDNKRSSPSSIIKIDLEGHAEIIRK